MVCLGEGTPFFIGPKSPCQTSKKQRKTVEFPWVEGDGLEAGAPFWWNFCLGVEFVFAQKEKFGGPKIQEIRKIFFLEEHHYPAEMHIYTSNFECCW